MYTIGYRIQIRIYLYETFTSSDVEDPSNMPFLSCQKKTVPDSRKLITFWKSKGNTTYYTLHKILDEDWLLTSVII